MHNSHLQMFSLSHNRTCPTITNNPEFRDAQLPKIASSKVWPTFWYLVSLCVATKDGSRPGACFAIYHCVVCWRPACWISGLNGTRSSSFPFSLMSAQVMRMVLGRLGDSVLSLMDALEYFVMPQTCIQKSKCHVLQMHGRGALFGESVAY